MLLLIASILALVAIAPYALKLRQVAGSTPHLSSDLSQANLSKALELPKVSVIVPAYNEAENLEECLISVLKSSPLPAEILEVWLTDDQSTDRTWAIAQSLKQQLNDPRLKLLAGKPRPVGQTWVGKNWACTQAVEQATGDFLLFLDADVRLVQGAIETAVETAQREQIDLLSCGPAIVCGCLAEWLVQPLIVSTILVGFNFETVNDPQSDIAFAAGPFMLFRRSAYEQVGGHRAVAHQVVEDVELARLIKSMNLKLRFLSGAGFVSVRMYRTWAALWEGWTKNLYLGSQRNLRGTLSFAILMLLVCTLPWLVVIGLASKFFWAGLSWIEGIAIALSLIAIAIQYDVRRVGAKESKISPRYWWLTGLGGILVAAIAIGSIIKTETGWGWTWRGRPLKSN